MVRCFCTRRRPSKRIRDVAKNPTLRIIQIFRFRNTLTIFLRACCIRSGVWHSPASNTTSQSRCLSIPVVMCIVTLVLPIMGMYNTFSAGMFTTTPVAPGYGRSGWCVRSRGTRKLVVCRKPILSSPSLQYSRTSYSDGSLPLKSDSRNAWRRKEGDMELHARRFVAVGGHYVVGAG